MGDLVDLVLAFSKNHSILEQESMFLHQQPGITRSKITTKNINIEKMKGNTREKLPINCYSTKLDFRSIWFGKYFGLVCIVNL